MTAPRVSVVIPVFNGAAFLGQALASVLAQDYPALEVIVIDDGSTDGSAEVAEAFGPPVVCHVQANAGGSAARNAGVLAGAGELLAFIDADDIWRRGKLDAQIALLESDGYDAVFGLIETAFEGMTASEYEVRSDAGAAALAAGTMLVRRQSFLRAGLFDPALRGGEFMEWYSRAQDAGLRFATLQQCVLTRRVHGNNTTIKSTARNSDYLRAIHSILNRRRRDVPPARS